jgi:hypothetical protein
MPYGWVPTTPRSTVTDSGCHGGAAFAPPTSEGKSSVAVGAPVDQTAGWMYHSWESAPPPVTPPYASRGPPVTPVRGGSKGHDHEKRWGLSNVS